MLKANFVLVLALFFCLPPCSSQNQLFESDEIITLRIQAPLTRINEDRSEDAPAHPAVVSYKVGKERIRIKASLEVRGNYRRRADICEFPPLKLKIKKADRAGTLFSSQKSLKLVTHCQGEKYVINEYMVYKFYRMLTPHSYQVRLVKIQYRDTEKGMPPFTAYAFIIESDRTLEKRLGGKEIAKKIEVPATEVEREPMTLVHMFQFMIGNLDWGVTHRKNMTLIQVEDSEEIIPVPYDFDFAACVQAPYTGLEKGYNRRNFRPICRTRAEYETLFDKFREKREALETYFSGFTLLPKSNREEALAYLNEFYVMIQDEETIEKIFLNACPSR